MFPLATRSVRHVAQLGRSLKPYPVASSSRVLTWDGGRRHATMSPFDMLRDFLAPKPRKQMKSEKPKPKDGEKESAKAGTGSIFDITQAQAAPEAAVVEQTKVGRIADHHKMSTANFKISHRKLNKLGRQIAGKPIDYAILQMTFSEKRASKRIKSMLVLAKQHAAKKGIDPQKMIVSESWVTKGPKQLKRLEPKGRGRHGIRQHPDSKMSVVLREGKTRRELMEEERKRKLKRIVSAGIVREDVPLRNPSATWAW